MTFPDTGGVWIMTDAEFKSELAEAFDAGRLSARRHAERVIAAVNMGRPELAGSPSPNPYRSQLTPHVGTIPPDMLDEMDSHSRQAREALEQ